MIRINARIAIPEKELQWQFVRASGPGGQNVNKVSTAVELRFDAANSATLPADAKARLREIAGSRMTADGVLVIQAQRFRSQVRNREDALERLIDLLRRSLHRPKARLTTKPTAASRARRIATKKKRAHTKRLRTGVKELE